MDFADQCEAPALQTFDYPDLPERPLAVELLRLDACCNFLQLSFRAGARQRRMSNVVVDTEVRIVDPDRCVLERDVPQLLAVTGNPEQHRFGETLDRVDVDTALLGGKRTHVKNLNRRHVHVQSRGFNQQERVVLRRKTLVFVGGHCRIL